jgi:F-type H+-transporting ATPase subunit b
MENLGIDYKLLIAQIVNFGLFFFIFKKFIAKPLAEFVKAEKAKEQEKENIMMAVRKQETEMAKNEEDAKRRLKEESIKALKLAQADAEKAAEEIIKAGQKQADKIIADAKDEMVAIRESAMKEVKNKVTDMSIFLVDKALKGYLTEDVQRSLTKHILTSLDSKPS